MVVNVTDVATFKAWGGQGASTTNDARITQLIDALSREIERSIGRKLEQALRTEDYDVRHDFQLTVPLRNFPVASIDSVIYSPDRSFDADETLDAEDYTVDQELGILSIDGQELRAGKGVLRVAYTGGFDANTAAFIANPEWADLRHAAHVQIQYEITRADSPGSSREFTQVGGTQWTGNLRLLPRVLEILARFRRRPY